MEYKLVLNNSVILSTNKKLHVIINDYFNYLHNLFIFSSHISSQQLFNDNINNLTIQKFTNTKSVFPTLVNEFFINFNEAMFKTKNNKKYINLSLHFDKLEIKKLFNICHKFIGSQPKINKTNKVLPEIKEEKKELSEIEILELEIKKEEERIKKEELDTIKAEENMKIAEEKVKRKQLEDRIKEQKSIFRHDKNVFKTLRNEMLENKRKLHSVPILFLNKYKIYNFMNEIGILDLESNEEEVNSKEWTVFKYIYYETVPNDDYKKSYWQPELTTLTEEEENILISFGEEIINKIELFLENINFDSIEELINKKSPDSNERIPDIFN